MKAERRCTTHPYCKKTMSIKIYALNVAGARLGTAARGGGNVKLRVEINMSRPDIVILTETRLEDRDINL
jgi:hypothetical protein